VLIGNPRNSGYNKSIVNKDFRRDKWGIFQAESVASKK
jgi:hypothetical protein